MEGISVEADEMLNTFQVPLHPSFHPSIGDDNESTYNS